MTTPTLARILNSFKTLVSTYVSNTHISIFDTPPLVMNGPVALIIPEGFSYNEPMVMGAGRNFYTVEGSVTVRVIDTTWFDVAFRDFYRLVDGRGLYKLCSNIFSNCNFKFLYDQNNSILTPQPIRITRQSRCNRYENTSHWFIDLSFDVFYEEVIAGTLADLTTSTPATSDPADILMALQNLISSANIFSPSCVGVSITEQSHPLPGTPLCLVSAGDFRYHREDNTGAGGNFATFTGNTYIELICQQLLDQSGLSDIMLTTEDQTTGLLKNLANIVELIDGNMLSLNGVPVVERPLLVSEIGRATPYRAASLASMKIGINTRFRQKVN